ncbi:hypothetical protein BUM88_18320 [Acinetobacter calcoaceticus]|uniref:hypothetical protein n=1 Tax=Acinetobacter calcoaceticus TaxID=471 RepID=UPI0009AD06C0|nr:hypothetical protein [Acinetobacter calcoaceticus]AQZ83393.1 hypothetical protein BUM88_18320 [Acinetobacter calcoaceticus]
MNKYLSILKDYQTLILVIPAILGGIYQIIMILNNLGVSYLKYFSVSQVIPDSLVIIMIFIYFFGIYKVLQMLFIYLTPTVTSNKKFKLYFYIFSIIILTITTTIAIHINKFRYYPNKSMGLLDFFGQLTLMAAIAYMVYCTIFAIYDLLYDYYEEIRVISRSNYFNFFKNTLLTIVLLVIFKNLPANIVALNNEIKSTQDLYNYHKLSLKISKQYKLSSMPTLIYSNKDYVFYKLMYNNNSNYIILALDTSELTSSDKDKEK